MSDLQHEHKGTAVGDSAVEQAPPASSPATAMVQSMLSVGQREPGDFAAVLRRYPGARSEIVALLHATLMAVVERRLHQKGSFFAGLPPLLTLEQLLFRVIGAAFVFLTLTLITGIAFSETLFGRALRADHKTVFAVLSWLTFGLLLAGRVLYGWRGRTALRWTLSGFMMLLFAYVGSRFVLEVLLHRA